MLARNLLVLGKYCIDLAEVDTYILPHIALHNSGHNIPLFLKILVVENFSLLLADFLHHNLLRLLRCDAPKVLRRDLNIYNIADRIFFLREFLGCLLRRNL